MSDIKINKNFFQVSAEDFKKIPGSPIAYWVSNDLLSQFVIRESLEKNSKPKQGATTSDNNRFLRFWFEVSNNIIGFNIPDRKNAKESKKKWFPYNKGGGFRRWYGNQDYVINYYNDGEEIKDFHEVLNRTSPGGRLKNQENYFQESASWSKITSGSFAVRYFPEGFIFDVAGSAIFFKSKKETEVYVALLDTCFSTKILSILSPTLNFVAGHLCKIPVLRYFKKDLYNRIISLSKYDWDSYDTSWDFQVFPLISLKNGNDRLQTIYKTLYQKWQGMTLEMQKLEEENNRIFIDAYGLQDELTPEVLLKEITLTCNPYYRYGDKKSEKELESLLLTDTMKELVSYAVGCILGRYSLDKDGLILANAGENIDDYLKQIPEPSIMPDESGILPITDENDFTDDLTSQFKTFLKASFGTENFSENLHFIEESINKNIRNYFIKDFYKDHVKRYKKRPIYWMISSPSGAFRSLIYLHRYTKDTISLFLNDYLRPYQRKLEAKVQQADQILISATSSHSDKAKAQKNLDKIRKVLNELEVWERDIVYPLATQRIELDLDDGLRLIMGSWDRYSKKLRG